MKNKSYIWISFIVLVFGIIFIPKIVNRIKDDNVVDADRHKIGKEKSDEKLLTVGKAASFQFINQNNDTITNKDYEGKVYVVEFFFTTCPTICPIMNRNMINIQNHFENKPDFAIASFTINPENDTPEVLKEYAQKYGVTNPNWHMLTGDRDKIYKLANEGFNLYAGINPEVEGGFEHSGMFALIDKKGNIRCRKDSFGNPIVYYEGIEDHGVEMIKEDIAKLLKEK
ncbi:SCO family protein [Abyssalbus ytuae]|uniref:SCO family protein n=1 Tax=Abyssalbus ytuae TaxID=2926907 RepID=A0A9E6ZN51_9FLAO|nr:SCO family protein [Abyssalbus ytuae]UOB18974.1 SCO family protein [Abyssalbus ytuae]